MVSTITSLAFALIGFALAVVLLIGFYMASRLNGVRYERMVALAAGVQTTGCVPHPWSLILVCLSDRHRSYVLMIVCLAVPFSSDRARALEYSFFVGNRLTYSAAILMYALCTMVFISVLRENSLPLVRLARAVLRERRR
jgi:hypothetical protein